MGATDILTAGWKEFMAEKAKENVQLAYWCKLIENFNFSPKEFYGMVVRNAEVRQIPVLEVGSMFLHESGPFSPERLYLQLRRERLVFEICGAPFGTGFFVSSRLFDRRRAAKFTDYLILFGVLAVIEYPLYLLNPNIGWQGQLLIFTGEIAVIWTLMRLAAAGVIAGLDRALSNFPVLGAIYDHFFHPDSYYREDLNNCYREAVHNAVMQAVDEMLTTKGLKALTPEERRPVLRDLHAK